MSLESHDKRKVVERFLNLFHSDEWPDFDDAAALFSEDTECYVVYPTTPPIKGCEALKQELIRQSETSSNPRCEIKGMAIEGDRVYVERVDDFITLGKPLKLCFCSVLEVDDKGLIKAWREYLDPTDTARQLGVSSEELQQLLQG